MLYLADCITFRCSYSLIRQQFSFLPDRKLIEQGNEPVFLRTVFKRVALEASDEENRGAEADVMIRVRASVVQVQSKDASTSPIVPVATTNRNALTSWLVPRYVLLNTLLFNRFHPATNHSPQFIEQP